VLTGTPYVKNFEEDGTLSKVESIVTPGFKVNVKKFQPPSTPEVMPVSDAEKWQGVKNKVVENVKNTHAQRRDISGHKKRKELKKELQIRHQGQPPNKPLERLQNQDKPKEPLEGKPEDQTQENPRNSLSEGQEAYPELYPEDKPEGEYRYKPPESQDGPVQYKSKLLDSYFDGYDKPDQSGIYQTDISGGEHQYKPAEAQPESLQRKSKLLDSYFGEYNEPVEGDAREGDYSREGKPPVKDGNKKPINPITDTIPIEAIDDVGAVDRPNRKIQKDGSPYKKPNAQLISEKPVIRRVPKAPPPPQ